MVGKRECDRGDNGKMERELGVVQVREKRKVSGTDRNWSKSNA